MASDAITPDLAARYRIREYRGRVGHFDEMVTADGGVRPHWQAFVDAVEALSSDDLRGRAEKLDRLVREYGIAYDIFSEPSSAHQPWRVNFAPILISPSEWAWIEKAAIQRARMFEALLNDIYGRQQLMAEGVFPPGIVLGDASFLRPIHNIPHTGPRLFFYAMDLARAADGGWRVLDSHTETPAGPGYALANRVIATNVSSDVFRATNVRHLAPFFQGVLTSLAQRAGSDDPRIALLTAGPDHEDYFGHAYLARYLGYPLVEGGDLAVVNKRVYLKTLEGLKPVDLLVRCVEAAVSDPLELDANGFYGPVGLVQALRANSGLICNGLGTAVAENRALGNYLPEISRRLLGEDLLLHDATRHWLGLADARKGFLSGKDDWILRPCQEGTGRPGQAVAGKTLDDFTGLTAAQIAKEIALTGPSLVAEPRLSLATSPGLTEEGLKPTPYAMRIFVAWNGSDYAVMPGGLAMAVDPSRTVALSAPDANTRDVWVLSDRQLAPHVSLWKPSVETAHVQRVGRGLQSRVADNLFWLGRYTERAEWTMRALRAAMVRFSEDSAVVQNWLPLGKVLHAIEYDSPLDDRAPAATSDLAELEVQARKLMFSTGRAYGLRRTLDHLHRTSGLTRDRLSVEAWRTLNSLFTNRAWRQEVPTAQVGAALDLLNTGIVTLAAFSGMAQENMVRNYGWRLLDLGRRIERGYNLAKVLSALFSKQPEEDQVDDGLLLVLELADSLITYRSRYRLAPLLPPVLDLLLMDETNPRSISFQLETIATHVDMLPRSADSGQRTEEQKIILSLCTELRLADVVALSEAGNDGQRQKLNTLLARELQDLPRLSEILSRRYFSHTEDKPRRVPAALGTRP